MYFTLKAHPISDWPHFKCSVTTYNIVAENGRISVTSAVKRGWVVVKIVTYLTELFKELNLKYVKDI